MEIKEVFLYSEEQHETALGIRQELLREGYTVDNINERIEFYEAVMELAHRMESLEL